MPKGKRKPFQPVEQSYFDIAKDVYSFFISMKFALIIILVIAVSSILGTIYQQGEFAYNQYITEKPELTWWYNLLKSFGIFDLYNTWWYLSLLALLLLSLILCSIDKIKRSIKRIRNPRFARNEKFVSSLKNSRNFILKETKENTTQIFKSILKKRLFYIREKNMGKGVIQLACVQGRYGALGSVLFHLSFIILAFGILYGGLFGFEGYGEAIEGGTINVQSGGFIAVNSEGRFFPGHNNFQVFVEDFKVTYDKMGSPKAFASTVKAMEGEKVKKEKVIRMNQPLVFKSYKVYQQSYGWAPDVSINDTEGKVIQSGPQKFQGDPKSQVFNNYILGNNLQIQATFSALDIARGLKPQLILNASQNGQSIYNGSIEEGKSIKIGDYTFTFNELKQYTGLSFVRNPGITIIYIGFIILTIGTLVALYIHEKRIWIILIPDGKRTKIRIGGSSERNKVKFGTEFTSLVDQIRRKS